MGTLRALSAALLAFVTAHPYSGLFLFLAIEEAGAPLPLPGDTLIMYAGARARAGQGNAALTILAVSAAATFGSAVLYWLARRGGRPALLRYGRFLHLHPDRVDRMEVRFRRWGVWAIILGRLIPGLRTPTSVMAGLFAVPFRVFAPCTALSAVLWALFYFYLGALLEPYWREALTLVASDLDAVLSVALIVGAVVLIVLALRRRASLAAESLGSD